MRVLIFLFCLFLLLVSTVPAAERNDIFAPLRPFFQQFKELAEQDTMLTRVLVRTVKEGNVAKTIDVLRTQSAVRVKETELRADMLAALCKRQGQKEHCEAIAKKLRDTGLSLQTLITESRIALVNRPLDNGESAGVLKIAAELQKNYRDSLFTLIRYHIASEIKKDTPDNPPQLPDIFSLKDIPELADIPMLPPPPSNKDIRLGQ